MTEIIHIDYARALQLVNDEVAKAGPDHIYELWHTDCYNVVENEYGYPVGSCLVGKAVIAAGIEPEEFVAAEAEMSAADNLVEDLGRLTMTEKATQFFQHVQRYQDLGNTWGESVQKGVEHVMERRWYDDEKRNWRTLSEI